MAEHQTLTREAVAPDALPGDSIPWVNSVFEQPWWLDAVAPGQWSAVELRRGDKVIARLPYRQRRRLGLATISQPPFTQTLGPWLAPMDGKYARRVETEKKLLSELVESLPRFDFFRQNLAPSLTNWLPFYWAGYQATVRYTYRICDLTDLDRVKGEFQEHVRRGIKKAKCTVEVDHDYPLEDLLRLNEQTYARQGVRSPHPSDVVRRLDAACAQRGARRILGAVDAKGRTHAALFVVWDERTLYALVNGRDPDCQTFGSNTLLYWEAIKLAAEVSQVFDFEGSMLQPVEHFIRGFGGRQTPYLSVFKVRPKAKPALAARSTRAALRRFARARWGPHGRPAPSPRLNGHAPGG
jgi:hypothetical protein